MVQSNQVVKHGKAMTGFQENIIRLEMNNCATNATEFNAEIEHFAVIDNETGAKIGIETGFSSIFTASVNVSPIKMTLAEYEIFTSDIVAVGETYAERLFSKKQQFLAKWILNNGMYNVSEWELIN